ncbi:hypothetical protein KXV85_003887, partial [Aspergillus fumigatus]
MFEDVLDHVVPSRDEIKAKLNDTTRAQLLKAMPALKERAKTLIELIDGAYFIFADRPLQLDPKAAALLTDENRKLIGQLHSALEKVETWSAARTEAALRAFAEEKGLKLGAVAQPLRAALTEIAGVGVLADQVDQPCSAKIMRQFPGARLVEPHQRRVQLEILRHAEVERR